MSDLLTDFTLDAGGKTGSVVLSAEGLMTGVVAMIRAANKGNNMDGAFVKNNCFAYAILRQYPLKDCCDWQKKRRSSSGVDMKS